MSHGDHVESAAAGVPRHRGEQRQPDRRVRARDEADLRRAVPSRGRAHAARRARCIANFLFDVCGATPNWTPGAFIEERGREDPRVGGRRAGDLRTVGRRGFIRGGRARAPGDRRPAHLRVRGHGPAAPARARAGASSTMRRHMGIKLVTVDAAERFLDALAGVEDPEAKRQRHRPHVHRRVRGGDGDRRDEREVPGAGDALSRRDRERVADGRSVGDDQDPPQRGRPQART